MQPAGEYLGEDFYRAGGVPAVVAELIQLGKIDETATTINGKSLHANSEGRFTNDRQVIFTYDSPLKKQAGFLNIKGNMFDSAIMKTSVISDDFRRRYLENPRDRNAFEGRAIVFDGPEDYHARIDDPALGLDEDTGAHHSRRRASRLSGRSRGGQHAPAGLPAEAGSKGVALYRRRPPIRDIGKPLDPQRLARGSYGRRPRTGAKRRQSPRRPWQSHGQRPHLRLRACRSARRPCRNRRISLSPRARPRGRRSSAVWSMSSRGEWCLGRRLPTSASRRLTGFLGTTIERPLAPRQGSVRPGTHKAFSNAKN